MSKALFEFREFTIRQDKCAMKIGTDGVLLGAWCGEVFTIPCGRILDIGTGTGVIALMCAQQWVTARIDAVEIDGEAAAQASENFALSPWADRLRVHSVAIRDFHLETEAREYDLIVSNPPFFNGTLLPDDEGRATARHTNVLPFDELMEISSQRLSEAGRLCIIFPTSEWDKVAVSALCHGLSPAVITDVVTRDGKAPKRSLAAFSRQATVPQRNTLTVRDGLGNYTESYRRLVNRFYKSLN